MKQCFGKRICQIRMVDIQPQILIRFWPCEHEIFNQIRLEIKKIMLFQDPDLRSVVPKLCSFRGLGFESTYVHISFFFTQVAQEIKSRFCTLQSPIRVCHSLLFACWAYRRDQSTTGGGQTKLPDTTDESTDTQSADTRRKSTDTTADVY